MPAKVVVVGSFVMDLIVWTPRRPRPGETVVGTRFGKFLGGKGLNQAFMARRLGAEVHMVGRLGRDDFGAEFLVALAAEGIHAAHVVRDPEAGTGVASPVVDATGQNAIVVVPQANMRLAPEDVEAARPALAAADVVLLQLEVNPAANLRAAEMARSLGKTVVLNPAPVPEDGVDPDLLRLADVIVPNEVEAAALTGIPIAGEADARRAAAALLAGGVPCAVITLGDRGALLARRSGMAALPAHRVEPVDTVGAGDAFCGALAVGLALGMDLEAAATLANIAAAISVTRPGAALSMPTAADIAAFARERGLPDPLGEQRPA